MVYAQEIVEVSMKRFANQSSIFYDINNKIFLYLYIIFYFTLTFKNVGPLTIKGKGNEPATILGVISGGYKACKGVAVCGDITSVLPWIKNTLGL